MILGLAKTKTSGPFAKFQERYRYDPAGFVLDCIQHKEGPTSYQLEILETLPREKRVAIRGPHGIGKTALASWVVLWGVLTADDCKVPTTASAWRQLTKFLWPEVHKWAGRLKWDRIGRDPFNRDELLTQSLKRGTTCEAYAVASDNADLIEGAHARRVVYIYDESKSVRDETFDASEGAFAGAGDDTDREAYALAISTPGEPQGRFYDIHSRKAGYSDWWTRHVTLSEAIESGRVSRQWAEQRKQQWGETSAVYQNRVLGEFAKHSKDSVISLAWVETANERWHEWVEADKPGAFAGVGVDVGRGGDQSVYALRFGNAIDALRYSSERDTMPVAGRTKGILDANGGYAVVDVIGVGAGVVDRLREQGYEVRAFNAGERTDARDNSGELGFSDKRSAAWWNTRELLSEGVLALPPDDLLTGDLTAPMWRVMSGGVIKVESKENVKKRLRRSTDSADAVIQIVASHLTEVESPFYGFV